MVREAVTEDLRGVIKLYQHLFPEEDYSSEKDFEPTWGRLMGYGDTLKVFVAQDDEEIVSSCVISIVPNLTRDKRPYALIENVITHPGKRKMGYGRKVMEAAIQYAKSQNCYKIMLLSNSEREDAHDFYRSLGFDDKSKQGFQMRLK